MNKEKFTAEYETNFDFDGFEVDLKEWEYRTGMFNSFCLLYSIPNNLANRVLYDEMKEYGTAPSVIAGIMLV